MSHWPLLSLVTFVPLIGVAAMMLTRGEEAVVARNARNIALSTSVCHLSGLATRNIAHTPTRPYSAPRAYAK